MMMIIHDYRNLFMLLGKRKSIAYLGHNDTKLSVDINATRNISEHVNITPYAK
jgi:hypothetical protein